MKRIVGYCGIICSDCPVFLATQKDDETEKERIAEMFTKQYGKAHAPKDINCDSCLGNSLFGQ